jgi:hypothetical protein
MLILKPVYPQAPKHIQRIFGEKALICHIFKIWIAKFSGYRLQPVIFKKIGISEIDLGLDATR